MILAKLSPRVRLVFIRTRSRSALRLLGRTLVPIDRSSFSTKSAAPRAPYVRIDVACENKWKAGREREKGSESTTNGRVSQSGSGKVSESRGAVGAGTAAALGSI